MKTVCALLLFSALACMRGNVAGSIAAPVPQKTEAPTPAVQQQPEHSYLHHGETIATGPSGALNCVDFGPGVCDVATAIVPLKENANTISGAWTFQQLRVSVFTVNALPPCNAGHEGQMAAVRDAMAASYNAVPQSGGKVHLPVYCNGTSWIMH
jgi:hypothetical protein